MKNPPKGNWGLKPRNLSKQILLQWGLLALALILCLLYAQLVPWWISPHDLGPYSGDWSDIRDGHIGYMQYICKNLSFPGEYSYQYYHPPLFHIVGAVVMKLAKAESGPIEPSLEILQLINAAAAWGVALFSYMTLRKLKRGSSETPVTLLTCILAGLPFLRWMGAALNNDAFVTLFTSAAVYFTVSWCEKPTIGNIMKICSAVILAAWSKTSGLLIAPAIGVVFLYRLIAKREERSRYIKQYLVFAVVCIPLGLAWVIRNRLLFGLPFSFVPEVKDMRQYVGDCSLWQRLVLPSKTQLLTVKIDFDHSEEFCNIWAMIFQTMNYDEGILHLSSRWQQHLALTVGWSSIPLTLGLMASAARGILSREVPIEHRLMTVAGWLTMMFSFVLFCFQYPMACTMNYRYIAMTVPFLCFSCSFTGNIQRPKVTSVLMLLLITFYAFGSAFLYIVCA